MAQSVQHLTLDFGSGHDLMILRQSPSLGSTLGMEAAWDSLSPSPSPCPLLMHMHLLCSRYNGGQVKPSLTLKEVHIGSGLSVADAAKSLGWMSPDEFRKTFEWIYLLNMFCYSRINRQYHVI